MILVSRCKEYNPIPRYIIIILKIIITNYIEANCCKWLHYYTNCILIYQHSCSDAVTIVMFKNYYNVHYDYIGTWLRALINTVIALCSIIGISNR